MWRVAVRVFTAAGVLIAMRLRPSAARHWSCRLLRALGVRWNLAGAPIEPGALLVGNHVSWLDAVIIMAIGHGIRPVSKIEVGNWPMIGRLARECGTIFVDRSRPRTLPDKVAEVAQVLRDGYPVQVFPEGTTTCGAHPLRWRPAFFQAAFDAGAPIQRFTLLYSSSGAAFLGEETLVSSLWRVLTTRSLNAVFFVEEPQKPEHDRRTMAVRLSPLRAELRAGLLQQRVHDRRGF